MRLVFWYQVVTVVNIIQCCLFSERIIAGVYVKKIKLFMYAHIYNIENYEN